MINSDDPVPISELNKGPGLILVADDAVGMKNSELLDVLASIVKYGTAVTVGEDEWNLDLEQHYSGPESPENPIEWSFEA